MLVASAYAESIIVNMESIAVAMFVVVISLFLSFAWPSGRCGIMSVMESSQQSIPVLSEAETEAVMPFVDRWQDAVLDGQRRMHQCATVLLSISAPLSASRQASGTPAVLSALAILAAAVSLIAGLRLLHAPARQSQEALQMALEVVERRRRGSARADRAATISSAWNRTERLCSRLQPLALIVSVILLTLSAFLRAF